MNKRCKLKQCLTPKELGDPSTVPTTYIRRQPAFVSSKFVTPVAFKTRDNLDTSFEEEEEDCGGSRPGSPEQARRSQQTLETFVNQGLEPDTAAVTEFSLLKSPQKSLKPVGVAETRASVAVELWPGGGAGTGKEGAGVISGGGAADGAGDLCLVMVLYKVLRQ